MLRVDMGCSTPGRSSASGSARHCFKQVAHVCARQAARRRRRRRRPSAAVPADGCGLVSVAGPPEQSRNGRENQRRAPPKPMARAQCNHRMPNATGRPRRRSITWIRLAFAAVIGVGRRCLRNSHSRPAIKLGQCADTGRQVSARQVVRQQLTASPRQVAEMLRSQLASPIRIGRIDAGELDRSAPPRSISTSGNCPIASSASRGSLMPWVPFSLQAFENGTAPGTLQPACRGDPTRPPAHRGPRRPP